MPPGATVAGAEVTAMVSIPLRMVIEVAKVVLPPLASVTLAVKLEVPPAVGVPDTTPVDVFSVRPAGSEPALIDQV